MSTKSDQDIADLLTLSSKDASSRLLKTMKSSRELQNAKVNGTLASMSDAIESMMTAVAAHLLIVDEKIGEDLAANAVTRRDHIDTLLPATFTSRQRLIDVADVLFSREPEDDRVTILFFRKERIVAVDHLRLSEDDSRITLISGMRDSLGRAMKDMAVQEAQETLGIKKEEDHDYSGLMPFDVEAEAKKQDGDEEAFARVHAVLPDKGAARRLFDMIRPYRDPSIKYRKFRLVKIEAIDHFLSYCSAHVKPLRAMADKILDFREYDDDVRARRHRIRRVKNASKVILRVPAYGRLSKAIECMGAEDGLTRHVTIEPGTLVESAPPSVEGAPRLIVETIDPELVERINDVNDGQIPTLSPVVVLYTVVNGRWSGTLVIGSAQIEYMIGYESLGDNDDPIEARLVSILSRAVAGETEHAKVRVETAPTRAAAAPPPLAARVRFRVDDVPATCRAIDAWHIAHLNKMGEDVLRSRAVEGSWLIEHLDGQDKTRRWSVRITAERTDRHVFTLELGADKGRNVVPRMPAVLRRIAMATTSRALDGPLHASARTVHDRSDVEDLNRALRDPTRTLPIVVVSSQGDQRLIEPDTLNVQTLGALDVWSIEQSAYEMLEERIGADMGVRAGETRMYMPGFTPDDSPFEHPTIHLSNSGQKRLSELVTREIGATLWRYDSTYEGHDQTNALADLENRERPEPLHEAEQREKTLPRIPSYREIRRRILPPSAREPSPSVHPEISRTPADLTEPLDATVVAEDPTPGVEGDPAEGSAGSDAAERNEPLLPFDVATDDQDTQAPVVPHHGPEITEHASEKHAPEDPSGSQPDVDEPLDVSSDVEDVERLVHVSDADAAASASEIEEPGTDAADDADDQRKLDLGDVPVIAHRTSEGAVETDGEAVRLRDIEVLFELYTEQMGETQSVMNDRIDAAVSRMHSIGTMLLTRMGIPLDELEPHVGPTAEQSRLREDDARKREHEIEMEEMKDEMRRLRAALDAERAASAARGVEARPYPQHMSEVREWFDATLSGRVHIVSKAWKSMRKLSNEYPAHAVERMCRALELLGGPGLDMHCGDQEEKRRWTEGLAELRLDQSYDSPSTSGPVGRTERTITYQGEKMFMNRHLRGSESGHNDRDLLRIYYVHHSETNQIVVGHLPSHLTTAAS
jgi:hypothetical protein